MGFSSVVINYSAALCCYIWILVKDHSRNIVIFVTIMMLINVLLFVISVLPASKSTSFVTSGVSMVSAILFLKVLAGS